ncbi:GNAT family N-acetyltransferase [Actinomadura harenae]|uniref:GNAT family N-acetyltransferase n=1 Tax=Actinomadura harenae TaxID=2483351 RepID=A0A3M2LTK4_9ACTN|nr:GNAT family N-acetyltransferase [Actinomadura harenae]RMI40821.1 GNAT family N-acetyltransferase [Actinomadura harenae]
MNVRHATPGDAEAIAKVHVDAWRTAFRGVIPDAELDALHWTAWHGRWRERTAPGSGLTVLVADVDGEVAGFACSGPPRDDDLGPEHAWELYMMYLGPASWRRGIGTALMRRTLEELPARVPAMVLWVLDVNTRARSFYERHGMAPDGTSRTSRLGPPNLDHRYRIDTGKPSGPS